jgi:hypothetical protein
VCRHPCISPSVCPRVTTREPLNGFSSNFSLGSFTRKFRNFENLYLLYGDMFRRFDRSCEDAKRRLYRYSVQSRQLHAVSNRKPTLQQQTNVTTVTSTNAILDKCVLHIYVIIIILRPRRFLGTRLNSSLMIYISVCFL